MWSLSRSRPPTRPATKPRSLPLPPQSIGGFVIRNSGQFFGDARIIASIANRHGVATVGAPYFAESGMLLGYGVEGNDSLAPCRDLCRQDPQRRQARVSGRARRTKGRADPRLWTRRRRGACRHDHRADRDGDIFGRRRGGARREPLHPGRNITGLTFFFPEFSSKRAAIARHADPQEQAHRDRHELDLQLRRRFARRTSRSRLCRRREPGVAGHV